MKELLLIPLITSGMIILSTDAGVEVYKEPDVQSVQQVSSSLVVPVSRDNQQIIRACNKIKNPKVRRKCLKQVK